MLDENKKPTLQDIRRIEPALLVQKMQQKKQQKRRSIFLILLAFFFALFFVSLATVAIMAYRAKRPVLDFGKTILREDLQFLSFQRYVFLPSNQKTSDSASNATDSVQDKTIAEKIKAGSIIEEASSMKKSKNDAWWLNSGGIMNLGKQEFSTNLGALPKDSFWRKLYSHTNSKDTDQGYFPQNIFRLVTKSKWNNLSQSVYFRIEKINMSESDNRNESNGVLLFNRYQDGDNLYYVGLRVDGDGVIKKKINEKYYTMAETKVFDSSSLYDQNKNPNLIPTGEWIGLKSEVTTDSDNAVHISLFIDQAGQGWKLVMETIDKNDKYGDAPFTDKGYAGIRTDFMDAIFKDYKIEEV